MHDPNITRIKTVRLIMLKNNLKLLIVSNELSRLQLLKIDTMWSYKMYNYIYSKKKKK